MFKNFKIVNCICIFPIFLTILSAVVFADDENDIDNIDINDTLSKQITETISTIDSPININSKYAVVIDRNSNIILFSKNENTKCKMASTTKIMTCLITIENCNLSDMVIISKKSAGTGGSRLGLKQGDKITVNDLLYGLMLCSGNDAAVALAEHISGSVSNFAILMNNKAKELNLQNTNFETPHGLDSDNHYTTAYELALLANHALNNKTFSKIVGTKSYTVNINNIPKTISNTNELLGNYSGIYGVKTGFTNGANRCLVTACKKNNLDLICVVLGADTKKFRTTDSIKLLEYCFNSFKPVNLQQIIDENFQKWKEKNIDNIKIIKGTSKNISLKNSPLEHNTLPIHINSIENIECDISCEKVLYAPIYDNTDVGTITLHTADKIISKSTIYTNYTINKKNIFNYFSYFWHNINCIDFFI